MKRSTIIILSIILFTNCSSDKVKTCHLSGHLIDRDSKILILKKQAEDNPGIGTEINIDSSGHFDYDLNFQFLEIYKSIFKDELDKGAWRPILIFPDNDKIELTLYPFEKADSNKIVGSELSLKESEFYKMIIKKQNEQDALWRQKMDSTSILNFDVSDTKSNETMFDAMQTIVKELPFLEFENCVKEQNNIYGYSKLLSILKTEKDHGLLEIDSLKKYCDLFEQNFPNHPYNKIAQSRFNELMDKSVDNY